MKLVVGLGNPGAKYAGTRHNVGFDVVDLLAERHGAKWETAPRGIEAFVARWRAGETVLVKPLTFMNLSGTAIVGLLQFYKVEPQDLLVIVDEAQLELARLRIRPYGSAGGHNGLKSVIGSLGTDEFSRLRMASDAETTVATSRTTCSRGSRLKRSRSSRRRSRRRRMLPNCSSRTARPWR